MTLDELFIKYGTDKSSLHHNYSPVYERLLSDRREESICMLILGIGGYHHIDRGGGDLRAFSEYMPKAKILAIDKYNKVFLNSDGISTFIMDQSDKEGLIKLTAIEGSPDIIIDDASHICSLTISSFEILFPLLKSEGIYIIEDVHSSYWDEIAGDGTDFGGGNHPYTTMNYFKGLCDALNLDECMYRKVLKGISAEGMVYDSVESITFYKKMIVIKKK